MTQQDEIKQLREEIARLRERVAVLEASKPMSMFQPMQPILQWPSTGQPMRIGDSPLPRNTITC